MIGLKDACSFVQTKQFLEGSAATVIIDLPQLTTAKDNFYHFETKIARIDSKCS